MVKRSLPWALLALLCTLAAAQSIDLDQVRAAEDFRWGVRSFHAGSFEQSILSLEKSLSIKPQDSRTRLWLGNALYRAGYEEAALAEWRALLARDPGNTVLENTARIITYRRGLERDLEGESQLVVAGTIDAAQQGFYPLRRPSSVHIRRDGSVYLVAFASNEIVLLDLNNRVRKTLKGGIRGYNRPYDCLEVEDPAGGETHLFIAEYGRDRVLKTKLDGEKVAEFGGRGSGPGMLLGPQYLAADGKGYLYVSDWGNDRVNKYDLAGNFILAVGQRGGPAARLKGPTGIAARGGELFVAERGAERGAGRIAVFDESGNFLYSVGQGVLRAPEGIVFRDEDRLLVADANRILEYNRTSEIWNTLSDMSSYAARLTHLDLSPNGEVYVVDFDGNKVFILSQMSSLYTSLFVQVERIVSLEFPQISVEVKVEDRQGRPVIGLQAENFTLSEGNREVSSPRLLRSPSDPAPLEITVLVEKSPAMKQLRGDLAEAVEAVYSQLAALGSERSRGMRVVAAGESAVGEAELGASRLVSIQAALLDSWSYRWRFDRGMRLAASQLIPATSRKAVVFMTSGRLGEAAFSEFSLAEVSDYLKNNSIPLYVVCFGAQPDRELTYICAETGGRLYRYFDAAGIGSLVGDIQRRPGSQYLLSYTSRSYPDFGKRFIDLQAQVSFHRKSGRIESGYFAPLSE